MEHSIWLLACTSDEAALQREVDMLAPLHEGHRFRPHLTLQGDLALPLPELHALAREIAAGAAVQHWPVLGVESTEHYFRALYLRFDGGAAFDALTSICSARSGTRDGVSPYPHVSLAYGPCRSAPHPQRARLEALYAGRTLAFDRVALVRSSRLVPIARWSTLAEHPLAP